MHPLNPYIIDQIVRTRQEEIVRKAAWNRLVRECAQDTKNMKAGQVKYRMWVVIGALGALVWFLR